MVALQEEDTHEVHEAQTPILENMVIGVPPVFEGLTKQLDKIVEQPLLGPKAEFPAGTSIPTHELTEDRADHGQRPLRMHGRMRPENDYRKRLRIEASKRDFQRILWELLEEP